MTQIAKAKKDLATGKMQWEGEKAQVMVEVDETRSGARQKVETMQEELRLRREKQYALLGKETHKE